MLKHLFLLSTFLIPLDLFSCTFIPETFCNSLEIHKDYSLIYGTILSKDEDGLDLEVIEILKGEETKSIIRIWDGTDFDCNGILSMSTENIGQINDSIIISLPKITEIENDWDVIGDYRRPDPYSYISQLKVEKGIAKGLIAGDAIAPDEYNTLAAEYSTLKESILSGENCSNIPASKNEFKNQNFTIFPNPTSSTISIDQGETSIIEEVKIYSLNGKILKTVKTNKQLNISIDINQLADGIYIIEMVRKDQPIKFAKIIKTQ